MNKVLDTPAKRSLWLYLLPILEEEHEQLARVFLSKHNILLIDKKKKSSSQESGLDSEHISKRTRFKSERFRRSTSNMHEDSREFGSTRSENINLKETKKTRPFSSSSSLQQSLVDDSELVVKFIKQVSYLLNMRERNELKYALKDYNESRYIPITRLEYNILMIYYIFKRYNDFYGPSRQYIRHSSQTDTLVSHNPSARRRRPGARQKKAVGVSESRLCRSPTTSLLDE